MIVTGPVCAVVEIVPTRAYLAGAVRPESGIE